MLPAAGEMLKQDFKVAPQPSDTFRLDQESKRIVGMIDGLEAIRQTVYCILNTERFEWLIYSWNYGAELNGLYGKPLGLVKAKLKKRIREALKQDDRILETDGFSFEQQGKTLHVKFVVHTVSGKMEVEKEVSI